MNVPNHTQAARIRHDIVNACCNRTPKAWRGNSYSARVVTDDTRTFSQLFYQLVHWDTTIAEISVYGGVISVTYFDARYISSTTRGFQSRILKALVELVGSDHPDVVAISQELGKPTHSRGVYTG